MKPSGISELILSRSLQFLISWEKGEVTLDDCLDTLRKENGPERGAVASLLFEYFRHKGFVDSLVSENAKKGKVNQTMRLLLSCVITQVFFQTGLARQSAVNIAVDYAKYLNGNGAGSFVNAMLRSILRRYPETPENIPASFPEKLRSRWEEHSGREKAEEIIRYFAVNPPLSFRQRKEIPADVMEKLKAVPVAGLDFAEKFKFFETAENAALFESRLLDDASIYIQDPATSLALSLADAPFTGRILDACAAPGGKTIMLADSSESSKVMLFASDRSQRRTLQLNRNLQRARIRCRTVTADACEMPYSPESFDGILADVPCSNTGVIRRRPDAPWRFSDQNLGELVSLQKRILNSLAGLVKPGGFLLYSTCSIEEEEDQKQIADFLAEHEDFALIRDRLLLPGDHHDGAYGAFLRKKPLC